MGTERDGTLAIPFLPVFRKQGVQSVGEERKEATVERGHRWGGSFPLRWKKDCVGVTDVPTDRKQERGTGGEKGRVWVGSGYGPRVFE